MKVTTKAKGMKVKTKVKAGRGQNDGTLNHNETLVHERTTSQEGDKAMKTTTNVKGMKVKSKVKAGSGNWQGPNK